MKMRGAEGLTMSTVAAPEIPNMPLGNATSEEPLESAKPAGAVAGIVDGAPDARSRRARLRLRVGVGDL